MTQDEVFAKVKGFAVNHSFLIANPLTERLSPIAGAVSLGVGFATQGKTPSSHENLLAGANAICKARKKKEHPNILAWRIASNQIRNDLLGLRVLTRNDTAPVILDLPPETQALKDKKSPFIIVALHSLGEILLISKMNIILANEKGVLFAAAPQPDTIMEKLKEKAEKYGLIVANTVDPFVFLLKCRSVIKNNGIVSVIEGTKPNPKEPLIPVNFLGQEVLLKENIYRLAAALKVPLVPAMSTLENGHVKVVAGRPIPTLKRKAYDIAQDWADSMTELTKKYPTSNLAFFELKFTARR